MRNSCALIAAFLLACGLASAGGGGGIRTGDVAVEKPVSSDVSLKYSLDSGPVTISVSGRIVDASTGAPLAGAPVTGYATTFDGVMDPEHWTRAVFADTLTDTAGYFSFTLVSPLTVEGQYKGQAIVCIDAGTPGYETRALYLKPNATRDNTSYRDITLALRRGRLLTGLVVDADGNPVEGALVKRDGNGSGAWNRLGSLGRTLTGSDGRFQLWVCYESDQEIPKPAYVHAAKDGLGVQFALVGDSDDLGKIALPPPATITGRVVDSKGAAVAGCEVAASAVAGYLYYTETDKDGRYALTGVPGAEVFRDFLMKRRGYAQAFPNYDPYMFTVSARLDPGKSLLDVPHYKITHHVGETLVGPDLVIDRAGVSGSLVGAPPGFDIGERPVILDGNYNSMVTTDRQGRFVMPLVPEPGRHTLTAVMKETGRITIIGAAHFETKEGQPPGGVDIPLYPFATVNVFASDTAGNPLAGVNISYKHLPDVGDAWVPGGATDASGKATFLMRPGVDHIVLAREGSDRHLRPTEVPTVRPAAGEILNLSFTMVEPAAVRGRFVTAGGAAVADENISMMFAYADGSMGGEHFTTDSAGRFETERRLWPGVATASIESPSRVYSGKITRRFELAPGEVLDLGDITCNHTRTFKVSGRIVPSTSIANAAGLLVRPRKDSLFGPYDVSRVDGIFSLPALPEGRHRLGAYMLHAPADEDVRPLGFVDINVTSNMDNVVIRLDNLAKVNVEIVDTAGNPVAELNPVAWLSRDHRGLRSIGAETDYHGKIFLYAPPNKTLYVGANDERDKAWVTVEDKEITATPGETVDGIRIVVKHAWE